MTDKYIARSSSIAARMIGGEMMIMSAVDSTFFTLNETATLIWQAADGVTPLTKIVAEKIVSDYEIDLDTAVHDSEAVVEDLTRHGILICSDRPLAPKNASAGATP